MKTQKQLISLYGNPAEDQQTFERKWMVIWDIPDDINAKIKALPNKMYCHKALVAPLEKTFRALIAAGVHTEIKTYDGCFNVRKKRGLSTLSVHAFGLAIDLNAAWNPLGGKVTWSPAFIKVWRDLKWTCGTDWTTRKDGMHFQWDN
jgi:hypothetical protein